MSMLSNDAAWSRIVLPALAFVAAIVLAALLVGAYLAALAAGWLPMSVPAFASAPGIEDVRGA